MTYDLPVFSQIDKVSETIIAIVRPAEEQPAPLKYVVQPGDTLQSIATSQNTTISRLFSKNTNIDNPDIINPGDELIIPLASEVLSERVIIPKQHPVSVKSQGSFNSSGNLYSRGFCTWYAKNRRPDLPNSLGNADTWLVRAQKLGLPTSKTPVIGSVAVAYATHVAIVEQVNGSQLLISDMNHKQLGVVSTRWVSTAVFQGYIL